MTIKERVEEILNKHYIASLDVNVMDSVGAKEAILSLISSQNERLIKALEFASQKRHFEGTPRMVADQMTKTLNEIANEAKSALEGK